ncbi:MAG: NAD(P)-dependent oxidoreductase [Thermoplasmatales archaeon]
MIEDSIISSNVMQLKSVAHVITLDPYAGVDKWKNAVANAIAIINRKAKLTKEILDAAPELRLIARTGVGVDETRIDLKEAKRRQLVITYNPGINSDSVAELTVLLVLSILRKLLTLNKFVRRTEWSKAQATLGYQIKGKSWGFIGFGNVGTRVANIAKAMGCKTYAFDPYLDNQTIISRGAEPLQMDDLLMQCDIISIHVPLTDSTKHLIGLRELSLMKNNAVLINVSRGGIVDDLALYKIMKNGKLLGAGLDTIEDEPIHPENPLLTLDNVIITPHIGGSTYEGITAGAELAVDEVLRFLEGKEPRSPYKYPGDDQK